MMPTNTSSGNLTADRRLDLAQQLVSRGDIAAAADLLGQTLEMAPDWAPLYFRLAECQVDLGRHDSAVSSFTGYLARDPADTMGAIIKLALLGAAPAPETLPAGYVETLFDDYAPRFDRSLVEKLSYATPQILFETVSRLRPCKEASERILDLGCGTGLSGAPFKARAAWIEGLDISAGMLEQAAAKKIYDRLVHGNILAHAGNLNPPYDLIIAADVFVYIGALNDVFKTLRKLVTPRGLVAFSVQRHSGLSFNLGADHRYAHSRAYLEQCAAAADFDILSLEDAVIRQEKGADMPGLIGVFIAPAINLPAPL